MTENQDNHNHIVITDLKSPKAKWYVVHTYPGHELKVTFNYDFVKYDGPEYEIIPLAKFVFWPTYAPNISRLDLYGRAYQYSMGDLLIDAKRGKLYQAKVDDLAAKSVGMSVDEWQRSRDFAEGVMPVEAADRAVELMDLAYKYDLDGDGIPEKYLVTFAPEHGILLAAERYPIRRNVDFCVAFGFLHRDGRFLRPSLLMACWAMRLFRSRRVAGSSPP